MKLIGIFDKDPEKIGTQIRDITIQDYDKAEAFIKEKKPTMAIIAVPRDKVSEVVSELLRLP